jgi:hypothetical protein
MAAGPRERVHRTRPTGQLARRLNSQETFPVLGVVILKRHDRPPYARSTRNIGGCAVAGYRPMTMTDLADRLARTADAKVRWKLVWEFMEEYRWESEDVQPSLLRDEPSLVGDERWDALLAALAEHLAAQHDLAPPEWTELRVLRRPWFPAELEIQRADALVRAPAAFRKHGVYLSASDLEAA